MSIRRVPHVLSAYFALKRLSSLTGTVPLGVFLIGSTFTNAISFAGAAAYDNRMAFSQGRPPFVLEFIFVFLPLAFHAAYGLVTVFEGRVNVHQYPHAANIRYTLQRLTGVISAVFVGWHVYAAHWIPLATRAPLSYAGMKAIFADPFAAVVYGAGIAAVTFHFFNGVWSALIIWGVTVSGASQKFVLRAASGAFAAVMFVHVAAVLHFAFPNGLVSGGFLNFVKLKIAGAS